MLLGNPKGLEVPGFPFYIKNPPGEGRNGRAFQSDPLELVGVHHTRRAHLVRKYLCARVVLEKNIPAVILLLIAVLAYGLLCARDTET